MVEYLAREAGVHVDGHCPHEADRPRPPLASLGPLASGLTSPDLSVLLVTLTPVPEGINILRTKKVGDNKVIQVLIVNLLCLENTLAISCSHLSLLMALLLTPAASTADIVTLWF